MTKLSIIIFLAYFTAVSASRAKHKRNEALEANIGEAFLVNAAGCSGAFISKNWILTAAHCYDWVLNYANSEPAVEGDYVYEVPDDEIEIIIKAKAARLSEKDSWTSNIRFSKVGRESYQHNISKIVVFGKYTNEALSWKGGDLALIELKPDESTVDAPKGLIAPTCLGDKDFPDEIDESDTFMIGFGRRNVPYCLTDLKGPERFSICRRPFNCGHTSFECGVNFEYDGEEYEKCSTSATPSTNNTVCQNLWAEKPRLRHTKKPIHIFKHRKYLTTCYAEKPPVDTKGWCATTPPGPQSDPEITATSGWGFCSTDATQKFCTEGITENDGTDNTTEIRVSVLNEEYCKEKLGNNLAVEQPSATADEYEDLDGLNALVCIGRNVSREIKTQRFFKYGRRRGFSEIRHPSHNLLSQLEENGIYSSNEINGGPSCFGDSGGPLFRLLYDSDNDKVVPVITGVFSFVLWGQCQGKADPSYYGRVKNYLDWIKSYVPEKEICWHNNDNRPIWT